jgi:hypothetical protein
MLNNILEEEDDCFVFFYENHDPEAHAILAELEGRNSFHLILQTMQASLNSVALSAFFCPFNYCTCFLMLTVPAGPLFG